VEIVRQEVATVLQILDDKKLDAASRSARISDRIARGFDFDDMSQSILAVNWKDATDPQKARFKSLLRLTLERKYIVAMQKRTTEVVKVGGERIRGDRASVIVTIERDKGGDIPLLFKLKRTGDGWKAYDANVEGLSLVQHYRERYAAIAASDGIAGVLAHMESALAS
jgi:phospholipid transport system substrate-binding protein